MQVTKTFPFQAITFVYTSIYIIFPSSHNSLLDFRLQPKYRHYSTTGPGPRVAMARLTSFLAFLLLLLAVSAQIIAMAGPSIPVQTNGT